jgi:hypothetical protein
MYRTAVMVVFLSTLGIIAADLFLIRIPRHWKGQADAEPPAGSGLFRWLRVVVNTMGFLGLAAVAATGFSALLVKGDEMTGDLLIWHVASAPAFALAAVGITLFWAHRNRFAAADWNRLTSAGAWAVPLRKLFFWLGVALTVPTIVSIVAAMFPLFGTDDQQEMFFIHRCCAPLLAASGLLFAYFALVTWRERSLD